MTMTYPENHARSATAATLRVGCDARACPECNAMLTVLHGVENEIVACPDCGQCLRTPPTWVWATTEWDDRRPNWPFIHHKYSGWAGVVFGSLIGAAALPPWIHVWGRVGAACLGMALVIEGVGRLLAQSREKADSRPAWHVAPPDPTREFGTLKAVFVSKNSLLDSLALSLLALAGVCGGAWVLSWMIGGLVHWKLIVCLVVAPILIGYIVYRSIRLIADRQHLVIRDRGMHVAKGQTERSFAWTDVRKLTAVHIGDMIDEDAIEIELRGKQPPVRFTRAKFPNIETVWERIVQEASDEVDSSRIGRRSVVDSNRG